MNQTRQPRNYTRLDYNGNKKIKLIKSSFEHLSNEILYEIFEYLDFYHVYEGFFDLNKQFQQLLLYSTLPIKINTPTVSKSNFERYDKNMIIPNKHRINILRLSNPFTVDIVLSPPHIISDFIRLKVLILDDISAKNLYKIFHELMFLPKLHTLVLNPTEYVQTSINVFSKIFILSKLKYCKITYRIKIAQDPLPCYFSKYDYSPVEHLIINARFPHGSLNNLLYCFPKLCRLSIDYLVHSRYEGSESCPIRLLKDLKYVSSKLNLIKFNKFEKTVQNFFFHLEVLRISTQYDTAYLDAKRWEHLITSYMPNLRIFDIQHDGFQSENGLTYHDLIDQFTSSFWVEKQWFFTHQHNWLERLNSGIFYSTQPYRRKDFTFSWQLDKQICSYVQETNLNSVKYVYISGTKVNNNPTNYFPNATELTIKCCLETFDNLLAQILNKIVPLHQLQKLVIKRFDLKFDELLNILSNTNQLTTLKTDLLSLDNIDPTAYSETMDFKLALNKNKIKIFDLSQDCTLEKIHLIIDLFSQLEYLKIGIKYKEIESTIQHALSHRHKTPHFFNYVSEMGSVSVFFEPNRIEPKNFQTEPN